MKIAVNIPRSSWACCGPSFALGDHVRWDVIAVEPGTVGYQFAFVDHGGMATEVAGTVESISRVIRRTLTVPGSPHSPALGDIESVVSEPSVRERQSDEFIVELTTDGAPIPPFVETRGRREARERAARIADREGEQKQDAVGLALENVADNIALVYSDAASILRSDERSAISVIPHDTNAAALHWRRASGYDERDVIDLLAGEGEWHLPSSLETVEVIRTIVEAVAAGGIVEIADTVDGAPRFATEVRRGDEVWRDETVLTRSETDPNIFYGGSYRPMSASRHNGRGRGVFPYRPWSSPDTLTP